MSVFVHDYVYMRECLTKYTTRNKCIRTNWKFLTAQWNSFSASHWHHLSFLTQTISFHTHTTDRHTQKRIHWSKLTYVALTAVHYWDFLLVAVCEDTWENDCPRYPERCGDSYWITICAKSCQVCDGTFPKTSDSVCFYARLSVLRNVILIADEFEVNKSFSKLFK